MRWSNCVIALFLGCATTVVPNSVTVDKPSWWWFDSDSDIAISKGDSLYLAIGPASTVYRYPGDLRRDHFSRAVSMLAERIVLDHGGEISVSLRGSSTARTQGDLVVEKRSEFELDFSREVLGRYDSDYVVYRHYSFTKPQGGITGYSLYIVLLKAFDEIASENTH